MDQSLAANGRCKRLKTPGIDMTPMVDLGFLLITFFIFTTTTSEPRAANLIMPAKGAPMPLRASNAMTVLLDDHNKIWAYSGRWEDAVSQNAFLLTNYHIADGLGSLIRAHQKQLKTNREDFMLVIKPSTNASYKNLVDALDETIINNVKRYVIDEPTKNEEEFMNGR